MVFYKTSSVLIKKHATTFLCVVCDTKMNSTESTNPSHQALSLSLCMVLIKLLNLHLTKDKSNICICFIFSFKNTLLSHILENDPSDEVSVFGSYVTSGYI